MYLFLLLSVPLTYLLINPFFNNVNIRKRTLLIPFLKGMILSIPFYLIYWSLFSSFFNNWTSAGLYFYNFLNRDGVGSLYLLLFFVSMSLLLRKSDGTVSRLREMTAWTAGFFATLAIYDCLVFESWYGSRELFVVPLVRMSLVLALPLLLNRSRKSLDWTRYLWFGLAVAYPFAVNFIALLSSLMLDLPAVLISLVVAAGSAVFYILEARGKL